MKEIFIIISSKYRIPFPSKLKEKLIGHFRARQQYKAHQTANIEERSSKTFVTFINKSYGDTNRETMYQGKLKLKEIHNKTSSTMQL